MMTGTIEESTLLLSDENDELSIAMERESPPRARRKRSGSDQFAQKQRKAREGALQVLFEVDLVRHEVEDVRARQFDQMLLADGFRQFAERLVNGVLAHQDDLDALIAEIAPAWPVPQLPRVDLNILRLALCELLYSTDVPVGAVINEAVELAKRYGSENSGKFINGALGTVAARITAGELTRQPAEA
jgi:transcription antitermination protein NusB